MFGLNSPTTEKLAVPREPHNGLTGTPVSDRACALSIWQDLNDSLYSTRGPGQLDLMEWMGKEKKPATCLLEVQSVYDTDYILEYITSVIKRDVFFPTAMVVKEPLRKKHVCICSHPVIDCECLFQ